MRTLILSITPLALAAFVYGCSSSPSSPNGSSSGKGSSGSSSSGAGSSSGGSGSGGSSSGGSGSSTGSSGGSSSSGSGGGGSSSSSGGSSSSGSSGSPSADGGTPPGASYTTASFHMEETIAAGQETFMCQLVTLPNVQAYLTKGNHQYTPGSHHILLYTTDLTSIPAGQDKPQDCNGAGASTMSHVHGVLYAGQTPKGDESFPPGVGLATTPSQVLLFQVHYLNATSGSLDAKVDVNLTLDTGTDVTTKAGIFFFYDPYIDVPAGAKAKASMRCPISKDITLIYATSHYHARGNNYGAYIDTAPTQLGTSAFYTSSDWSSPPNATMSMPIKAGSRLRFECDYDNSSGTMSYFQGQSAQTNEMCMFIGTYYPEVDSTTDNCASGADMFGNGTATCSATLSCLEKCGTTGFGSQCEQTCYVDSCPSAATPLGPLMDCIQASCASSCVSLSSSSCQSCITSSCSAQNTACQSQTCP